MNCTGKCSRQWDEIRACYLTGGDRRNIDFVSSTAGFFDGVRAFAEKGAIVDPAAATKLNITLRRDIKSTLLSTLLFGSAYRRDDSCSQRALQAIRRPGLNALTFDLAVDIETVKQEKAEPYHDSMFVIGNGIDLS
jgi:hypothetical protein